MKVIIAGSRSITKQAVINSVVDKSKFNITEIVSGCASGVDTCAINLAKQKNILLKRMPADWSKFGKSAGYKRNEEMAEYADALIAIWDFKSKGTKHMIDIAKTKGLKVFIHTVRMDDIILF